MNKNWTCSKCKKIFKVPHEYIKIEDKPYCLLCAKEYAKQHNNKIYNVRINEQEYREIVMFKYGYVTEQVI